MIYYISQKKHEYPGIRVIEPEEGLKLVKQMFDLNIGKDIYIDTETNGLDAHVNKVLLVILYDGKDNSYILDATTVDVKSFFPEEYSSHIYVGHNIKFDCKMMNIQCKVKLVKTWDTMIAFQKYYQGNLRNKKTNPEGVESKLPSVIEKILNITPGMDKDIRKQFIGIQPSKFIATHEQLIYADKDVRYLPQLKIKLTTMLYDKQIYYMDLYGTYLPFCTGLMETNGFDINENQWLKTVKENEKRKFEIECELDEEFRNLRYGVKENTVLIGDKYDRKRVFVEKNIQQSLFDLTEFTTTSDKIKNKKEKTSEAYINWTSTTQIVRIFALLELPLPVDHKTVTNAIPLYRTVKNKKTGKDKIQIMSEYKFTTTAPNIHEYLNENPNTITRKFFELLMEYREMNTALSTFGKSFLDKRNPITGRIHTIFRTDVASTGRFQSGEKDTMYPNFQNIPRKEVYRTSFIPKAKNRKIITLDLSGAEVTIMCDKAHDTQLYEWAVKNDDAHSPIATASWRNIFLYRLAKELNIVEGSTKFIKQYDNIIEAISTHPKYHEILSFTISKKENKEYRQTFKNLTFAAVYNVHTKKAAKILNVANDESAIALWTIKSKIPKTFAFVEEQSKIAMEKGVVRINTRAGTRIIFPSVIRWKLAGKSMEDFPFMERVDIEGAARNVTIQGTQADMLKEAFVEATLYVLINNLDIEFKNKVHDELVVDVPEEYTNETVKFFWVSDKEKYRLNPEKYKEIVNGERPYFLPLNKRETEIVAKTYTEDNDDVKLVTIQEFFRLTMITAASRYLTHYKMGSSCEVADTWVK